MLFNVPIGKKFWGMGEHEILIVDLFTLIVTHRDWKEPQTARVSELESRTLRYLEI